jgi:hypothetical protein
MQDREVQKVYYSALMAVFFVFVNSVSDIVFITKRLALKIDNAATSGGHGTLTYFMYVPWPPLEAGLSTAMFISYLHVLGSLYLFFTRC